MNRRIEAVHRLLETGQLSLLRDGKLFKEVLREEKAISDWLARFMGLRLVPIQVEEEMVGFVIAGGEDLPGHRRRKVEGFRRNQWLAEAVVFFERFLYLLHFKLQYHHSVGKEELERRLAGLFEREVEELREVLREMAKHAGGVRGKGQDGLVWAATVLEEFLQKGVRYGAFYEEHGYIRLTPAYLWFRDLYEKRGEALAAFGAEGERDEEREGED